MTTILDTILEHKQTEVAARKARAPQAEVQALARDAGPTRGFARALRQPRSGRIGLIAEVKKASPSAGVIRADFDPVQIAQIYEAHGADCLSVLTDERFFQGHDDFFRAIRDAVRLPMIRKDFVIDAYQITEARALGADAVLLIAAALLPVQIADYQSLAHELGMDALVEVHTEDEMETALRVNAPLIGINSRDLKHFTTDLTLVERLAALVPAGTLLVAESGLKTPDHVEYVRNAGAGAILVGETLMRSPDIGAAVQALLAAPEAS